MRIRDAHHQALRHRLEGTAFDVRPTPEDVAPLNLALDTLRGERRTRAPVTQLAHDTCSAQFERRRHRPKRFGATHIWRFADPAGWKCSPRYADTITIASAAAGYESAVLRSVQADDTRVM